jgi:hypothetical protein
MTIDELIKSKDLENILKSYDDAKLEKEKVSYNLFSLSSYNNQLENFHSDIIASLLNPKSLHGEKNKYLNLFLEFLNSEFNSGIILSDFENAIVSRETGRIDVWIRDEISKKSIIIENKINNAPDMDEQVDRYFEYTKSAEYETISIIYLSLDGLKFAPPSKDESQKLIKNIGAFNNQKNDLVEGWLNSCLKLSSENQNSYSIIYQYIKLLKQLANKNMDTNSIEDFYKLINNQNSLETIKNIIELSNRVPAYRTDKFVKSIEKNYRPFTKSLRYYPNYHLFENYLDGNNIFKLDISFNLDGSVQIMFWIPAKQNDLGKNAIEVKLKSINMLNEFNPNSNYGYTKLFNFNEHLKTLSDIDIEVLIFVKDLFLKLNR